jgi:hypothetical protein
VTQVVDIWTHQLFDLEFRYVVRNFEKNYLQKSIVGMLFKFIVRSNIIFNTLQIKNILIISQKKFLVLGISIDIVSL